MCLSVKEKVFCNATASCQDISSTLPVQFYRAMYEVPGGGLISIIAFNIFHYPYLILLEHDTKEQFDCEQVQNKLFLLIIPGFNSLFMVH